MAVYVKISSEVQNGSIYYTTDGTDPTSESILYTEPFPVYKSCTIKAISVKDEWVDSDIASLDVEVVASNPQITRVDGTGIDNCYIFITNMDDYAEGTKFYYTLDGTDPTTESKYFVYGGGLNVTGNCTVKIMAGGDDITSSEEIIEIVVEGLKCQTPVGVAKYDISVPSANILLTCATKGANIYYTTDGSDPGNESYLYERDLTFTENCTLKFVADKDDLIISEMDQFVVVLKVDNPSLYLDDDGIVWITNMGRYNLDTVQFFYTTDGTDPNATSATYNSFTGISAPDGATVKVVGIAISGVMSDVVSIETPTSNSLSSLSLNFIVEQDKARATLVSKLRDVPTPVDVYMGSDPNNLTKVDLNSLVLTENGTYYYQPEKDGSRPKLKQAELEKLQVYTPEITTESLASVDPLIDYYTEGDWGEFTLSNVRNYDETAVLYWGRFKNILIPLEHITDAVKVSSNGTYYFMIKEEGKTPSNVVQMIAPDLIVKRPRIIVSEEKDEL